MTSNTTIAVRLWGEPALARQPYRPMPADFAERFIEHGWGGIEAEYHAHKRTIRRWLDAAGRERLVLERQAYLARSYRAKGKGVPGRKPKIPPPDSRK